VTIALLDSEVAKARENAECPARAGLWRLVPHLLGDRAVGQTRRRRGDSIDEELFAGWPSLKSIESKSTQG
jgi:hypothetical protein